MIPNITKRLIINSNRIIVNPTNRYLYNSTNHIYNVNNNNNNNFNTNNNNNNRNIILPVRFYSSNINKNNRLNNSNSGNNDNVRFNSQKEALDMIYEIMMKKVEEAEKRLNAEPVQIVTRKTKAQILLSRHGSIVFLLLCIAFLGTMIYFYFQKRKHILLTSQVEHHGLSTVAELEKLKIDLEKIKSKLSTESNQTELVDLIITEIIQSNGEARLKLSPDEINQLKSNLKKSILSYQQQQQ